MPYYGVQQGKSKGVYNSWDSCKPQVSGYSGAVFHKFSTPAEAKRFVSGRGSRAESGRNSSSKSASTSSSSRAKKQSIYTDGASRGNGQSANPIGGYGVFHGDNHPKNAAVPMLSVKGGVASSQRAELAGVKHALKDVLSSKNDGVSYTIKSDSQYAIDTVKNSLKTSNKNVQNLDLINQCVNLDSQIREAHLSNGKGNLYYKQVSGHKGIYGNEQADRLANLGADKDTK